MDLGIFLAAFGITLLKLTEASAVGVSLYVGARRYASAYLSYA